MTEGASQRPTRASETASRVFGNDGVVISPKEGIVRMLNPTATRIWQLADGSRSVEEIAAVLADEYGIQPEHAFRSTTRFLAELSERELISWIDS